MYRLPLEVLEQILTDPKLSIQDVSNFALTCRHFYNLVVNSSVIWKRRFFEKYPQIAFPFNEEPNRYFDEFQYFYNLKKRTFHLLAKMSRCFYKKYHLSDFDMEAWKTIINGRHGLILSYNYLDSLLTQILNTKNDIKSIEVVPFYTPGNKTMQYYALIVLRYITQLYLSKLWAPYLRFPSKNVALEKFAVFVAQWSQSEVKIPYNSIAVELDRYTDLVRWKLFEEYPNHSLFNVPREDLYLWREGKQLTKSQFKGEEFHQIFKALYQVFFYDLQFGIDDVDLIDVPENLSINNVLKTKKGPYSILLIIYESVGRRLGLMFEPITNLSRTFLLRYTDNEYYYYIDVSTGYFGPMIKKGFEVATTRQIIEWVVEDQELAIRLMSSRQPTNENTTRFKRSIMELHALVAPHNLINLGKLVKFYLSHDMNTLPLMDHLTSSGRLGSQEGQRISYMLRHFSKPHEQQDEVRALGRIQRTNTIKFAVGMVMAHTRDNYKCVIISWDPICLATLEWKARNAVSELNGQPFYHVLKEDGSREYVAQEHLMPSAEAGSLPFNLDLGHYFSHFFENHFIPNAVTEEMFPADREVRHRFYHVPDVLSSK